MVNSTSLAVQFLQCEALLVTVTLKCYVFLTGKQVSSYSFSVFLANGPSTVSFLIGYSTVWGAVNAHCSQLSGCPGGRNWSSRLAWTAEQDTISKQASIHQQHQDSCPYYHFNMVFERGGILGLSAWQDGPLSLLYLMLLLLPQVLLFCLCISIEPFTPF